MTTKSRVRIFMACSFDGFIAGPNNDLGWLNQDRSAPGDLSPEAGAVSFEGFMSQVGAMLMGRTTYEAVEKIGMWPYGELPVLVATHRPLNKTMADTVTPVAGSIETLIVQAKDMAGAKDVYLDGGNLARQALNAGLVDEIIATYIPVLLGEGTRLFDGLVTQSRLQFVAHHADVGGMLQVTARVLPAVDERARV